MDLGLKDRLVIVGGGSKGIGQAAARRFSLEGARVVIAARTPDTLERTAREIAAESGVPVETFATDLTTENGRAALVPRPTSSLPMRACRNVPLITETCLAPNG
jgi:3-oxoacyl-[acyl-carrier protein] reductase